MNKIASLIILFALLAAGCVSEERDVTAPPRPVESSSINAYTLRPGTRVIINLSEQRAYLVEGGKVSLIAPIASGKPGWATPTGNFAIISKDIDHRSQSFGSIIDGSGRIAIANATPGTHVPDGFHYQPAPMPYYMEFSQAIGMHAGFLPGYPASHGCVRMPRGTVFRTGPSSNSGDGRRQHAEPDSSPNSHPTLRVSSLLCVRTASADRTILLMSSWGWHPSSEGAADN